MTCLSCESREYISKCSAAPELLHIIGILGFFSDLVQSVLTSHQSAKHSVVSRGLFLPRTPDLGEA